VGQTSGTSFTHDSFASGWPATSLLSHNFVLIQVIVYRAFHFSPSLCSADSKIGGCNPSLCPSNRAAACPGATIGGEIGKIETVFGGGGGLAGPSTAAAVCPPRLFSRVVVRAAS